MFVHSDCCKDPDTPGIRNSHFTNSQERRKVCLKVNGLEKADESFEHVRSELAVTAIPLYKVGTQKHCRF